MPLYEYRCPECDTRLEILRRISEADAELVCPNCKTALMTRQFSTFATTGCGSGGAGRFT